MNILIRKDIQSHGPNINCKNLSYHKSLCQNYCLYGKIFRYFCDTRAKHHTSFFSSLN